MNKEKTLDFTQYINYVALAYAFVLPLSRAGVSFFTALLVLLWVLEGNFKSKIKRLLQNNVVIALCLFLIFNLISAVWTNEIQETLEYVGKYWFFLPIIVFFTSLQKEYIPKVTSAFILGMFISEVIAYGVFFDLWHFKHATAANPSPFMHHIEYSVFLAFTALMLLSRIFNSSELKYKLLYSFFFITISGNLFLTAGRTGQIAYILGLFVLSIASFKNRFKALMISLILSIFVLGSAFNLSNTFHERVMTAKNSLVNVIEREDYCSSWGSRAGAWVVSKDIIVEHPLVGVGIVDNMKEFHTLIDTKYPQMKCVQANFMHMHNQYLQILTELGIVGLILFLFIFYRIANIKLEEQEYRLMKYIYITVLLFSFVPEVIFHRQFSMALFALIIGLLLAESRTENEV